MNPPAEEYFDDYMVDLLYGYDEDVEVFTKLADDVACEDCYD